MAKINSNKPFKGKPNLRKGAGPVYNRIKPFTDRINTNIVPIKPEKNPCFGEFDNLVTYVFEYSPDGNHFAYVDCDYVE
jgi:hypothetical protein